jgi:hypothetical protein
MHCCVCYFYAIRVILPVMGIWVDLQVLKIWDLGSTLKSRRAKPSKAKPTAREADKGITCQRRLQGRVADQSALGLRPRWTPSQLHR